MTRPVSLVEIAGLYDRLRSPMAVPALTATRIDVRAKEMTTEQEVGQCVRDFCARFDGWLRCFSWAGRVGPSQKLPPEDAGAPLDGEWVVAQEDESRRLVYLGRSGPRATVWRLVAIKEGTEGATEVLRETIELLPTHLASTKPGNVADPSLRLRYAIYWGLPDPVGDPSGIRRLAARLVGLELKT